MCIVINTTNLLLQIPHLLQILLLQILLLLHDLHPRPQDRPFRLD